MGRDKGIICLELSFSVPPCPIQCKQLAVQKILKLNDKAIAIGSSSKVLQKTAIIGDVVSISTCTCSLTGRKWILI